MIGYKGFNKNFCCKGFQYEVGKTYRHDGDIKICESGFHFCDNPLAVFEFYDPVNSRFALVEAGDKIVSDESQPHKFCTNLLTIKVELSLNELIDASENRTAKPGDWSLAIRRDDWSVAANTGVWSVATTTGFRSVASNRGDYATIAATTSNQSVAMTKGFNSVAINTGIHSTAIVTKKESIAIATGWASKAKGALDCWLVLAEYNFYGYLISVQAFKVDGVTILPDVFYRLKNGVPVPADD